jgi:hypothetical protein
MESQVCLVEDAQKNANILHCVWMDEMFQEASVSKVEKTGDKKGLLLLNQQYDS